MTSPDPEIDGGLRWIRGWIRPLDPPLDPPSDPPWIHLDPSWIHLVPGVVPTLRPTLQPTSRKSNPPRNRLHGRETRLGTDFTAEKPGRLPKKVLSRAVQRKHPFPSHDEDLACVTMGNFFVPIELRCLFLRESLPSLPTNKTLLLFPRKAVGAFFPTKAQDGFSHHNRTLLANSQRSRPTDDPDLVSLSFAPL